MKNLERVSMSVLFLFRTSSVNLVRIRKKFGVVDHPLTFDFRRSANKFLPAFVSLARLDGMKMIPKQLSLFRFAKA